MLQNIQSTIPESIHRKKRCWSRRFVLDRISEKCLLIVSFLPVAMVISIVFALFVRSQPILIDHSIGSLLTGEDWHPVEGRFGFLAFILGTAWVSGLALCLAAPPSLLTAIYLAEYAKPAVRSFMKPVLDLLAAIPSVVYGIWGILAIVPMTQQILIPLAQKWLKFIPFFISDNPTGYGIFSGSVVLAVMITPFIISLTFEVIRTVPDGFREASLSLGATHWQMVKSAVIPQVMPGILAGIMLGISRAFGETMAVLMVVGNVPQIPRSIFDAAYPLPALIANNYGEMLSIPQYEAALMSAALMLLVVILLANLLSTLILHRLKQRSRR